MIWSVAGQATRWRRQNGTEKFKTLPSLTVGLPQFSMVHSVRGQFSKALSPLCLHGNCQNVCPRRLHQLVRPCEPHTFGPWAWPNSTKRARTNSGPPDRAQRPSGTGLAPELSRGAVDRAPMLRVRVSRKAISVAYGGYGKARIVHTIMRKSLIINTRRLYFQRLSDVIGSRAPRERT